MLLLLPVYVLCTAGLPPAGRHGGMRCEEDPPGDLLETWPEDLSQVCRLRGVISFYLSLFWNVYQTYVWEIGILTWQLNYKISNIKYNVINIECCRLVHTKESNKKGNYTSASSSASQLNLYVVRFFLLLM